MIDLVIGEWPLLLYCPREAILGRRVMELGCGCGNLGKLLARYAASYLGIDFSTLALQVARLVSPDNCTYLHVRDVAAQRPWHATIDTVVSRHFWIHQNLEMGRHVLSFLADFLYPGGRLYADFYAPGGRKPGIELSPEEPLLASHPSALFCYDDEAIAKLIEGLPFRLDHAEVDSRTERRYAQFTRQG
jgi:SAM-dependent methyltransferase